MKSLVAIRLSLLISLCAIGLSAQTAHAQASGEVLIIHAQESAGEIDPAVKTQCLRHGEEGLDQP